MGSRFHCIQVGGQCDDARASIQTGLVEFTRAGERVWLHERMYLILPQQSLMPAGAGTPRYEKRGWLLLLPRLPYPLWTPAKAGIAFGLATDT